MVQYAQFQPAIAQLRLAGQQAFSKSYENMNVKLTSIYCLRKLALTILLLPQKIVAQCTNMDGKFSCTSP